MDDVCENVKGSDCSGIATCFLPTELRLEASSYAPLDFDLPRRAPKHGIFQ